MMADAQAHREEIRRSQTLGNKGFKPARRTDIRDEDFDPAWLLLTDMSMRRFSPLPDDFFEKAFEDKDIDIKTPRSLSPKQRRQILVKSPIM